MRGRCVQATKNKAEACSLLDAIGRSSCRHSGDWVCERIPASVTLWGLGIKTNVWEYPVAYASTRDWSSLYGTMRSESAALNFECLLGLSCLSSACIVVGAVSFTVTPAENFSPLSLRPLPLRVSSNKKSRCRPRQSVHPSERLATFPSSFFLLQTLRSK